MPEGRRRTTRPTTYRGRGFVLALSVALLAGGVSAFPAGAAPVTGPAVEERGGRTAAAASRQAAESGEPVEVVAERSEYTETLANPDGTYTLNQFTTPQRARAEDGSWRDIDVTLERRADGTIGPKAAVVDLAFSGGGSGEDLIRLGSPKGAVELGWAGTLPAPRLEGPTATYPDVYEGVDLQLTATPEGFREVLVVKSAEAAANPALDKVSLSAKGDRLDIVAGPGGGMRALDDDGNAVFTGPAGVMWDSSGDAGPQTQLLRSVSTAGEKPGLGDRDRAQPGEGDTTAMLPVEVGPGTVSVRPDKALLRGKDTVYPVYIDPPLSVGHSERTVLSSDGDRFWAFNGDYSVGRCGMSGAYYCTTGTPYTNRMYFEFAPTNLVGKYVIDATFRAYETWSFDCNPHWIDLKRTNNISESTRWPGPTVLDHLGDRNVAAGRGDNCSPSQPDSWIEFNDNPDETDENLTPTVRSFAAGKFSRLTLMLAAKDETDPTAWKRFKDNAVLQVVYVPYAGVPTGVGVIPGEGVQPQCATAASPTVVTRLDPYLQAYVQTQVQPKGTEFTGSLRSYKAVEKSDGAGGWNAVWTSIHPASGFVPDGSSAGVRMPAGQDGATYRYKTLTQSYYTHDGTTRYVSSPFAAYCYFTLDTTAPKAPTITFATGTPYTECTATSCVAGGSPGTPGRFTLAPNAADTDITSYRWTLQGQPPVETAKGTNLTIEAVPSLAGTQILTVQAKDVRNRYGTPAEVSFKVKPASGAVGRWHFDDGTPGSTVAIAADSAEEGGSHPATLHPRAGGTAADWSPMGRLGGGDHSLALSDAVSDPVLNAGYAVTEKPPVNTRDSFTVSAWAYLNDTSQIRMVASAPGTYASAFNLFYSSATKKWAFNRVTADVQGYVYADSLADTPNPPTKVWTHLAGVFDTKADGDKTNDTIQLFVNGRPQGKPVVLNAVNPAYTPLASAEGMLIGRSKPKNYTYSGRIDEVAVWQRALTGEEIRAEGALTKNSLPATELVGHWNMAGAASGRVPELTPYPAQNMTISATGAAADSEAGELVLDGVSGSLSTPGPVVDETGSFTVTASVRLDSAKLATKPVGYRGQVFGQHSPLGQESSWALWVEKLAEDVYVWKFGRTATGPAGNVVETASVPSQDFADLDTPVQITGVFDAAEPTSEGFGATHLYVGALDQLRRDPYSFTTPIQGSGPLSAGAGAALGRTGHHLPGGLGEIRVWTGAMTADQVGSQVLPDTGTA
ncbi:LamG domain-containing protein [Streptomyces sp. NPDC047928]|uniref:LamG domain-containing protein n=1 Tax=unclassified Streptomyces TaxID=2593676 RepID=UPI003712CE4C